MISDISQNMLVASAAKPVRESGDASRTQSHQAVATPPISKANEKTQAGTSGGVQGALQAEEQQLEEVVDNLNGLAQSVQRQLEFSVDDDNGKVFVKVVDAETKDVIREIPSEEIRNMQKHLQEVSDMIFNKEGNTSLLFQGEA